MLNNGQPDWAPGDRIRVYRAERGRAGLLPDLDAADEASTSADADPRDYDIASYLRLLRETFAARLARGLSSEDFAAICADPEQPSLFERALADAQPTVTVLFGFADAAALTPGASLAIRFLSKVPYIAQRLERVGAPIPATHLPERAVAA